MRARFAGSARAVATASCQPSGKRQSAWRKRSHSAWVAAAPRSSWPPRPGGPSTTRAPIDRARRTVSSALPPSETTTSTSRRSTHGLQTGLDRPFFIQGRDDDAQLRHGARLYPGNPLSSGPWNLSLHSPRFRQRVSVSPTRKGRSTKRASFSSSPMARSAPTRTSAATSPCGSTTANRGISGTRARPTWCATRTAPVTVRPMACVSVALARARTLRPLPIVVEDGVVYLDTSQVGGFFAV